jgi:hypothetical protein
MSLHFLKQKQEELKNNPFFQKWFGQSKVSIEIDNITLPKMVYHGTTFNFDSFNKSRSEGFVGDGFYFSDSIEDTNKNYAGIGPDLENYITATKEKIEDLITEDNYDDIHKMIDLSQHYPDEIINNLSFYINEPEDIYNRYIEKYPDSTFIDSGFFEQNIKYVLTLLHNDHRMHEFSDVDAQYIDYLFDFVNFAETLSYKINKGEHDGFVMPCYLSMQNPFYMTRDNETHFNFDFKINDSLIDDLYEKVKNFYPDFLQDLEAHLEPYILYLMVEDEAEFDPEHFLDTIDYKTDNFTEEQLNLFTEELKQILSIECEKTGNGFVVMNYINDSLNEFTDYNWFLSILCHLYSSFKV